MTIPVLPRSTLDAPSFPASPKRSWRAALAVEGAKVAMTHVRADWLATDGKKVLTPDLEQLTLWVIRPDGARAWCAWHRKQDRWILWSAISYDPLKRLTHKEFMAWMKV